MQRKKGPADKASEQSSTSKERCSQPLNSPHGNTMAASPPIDFLSPEFNIVDDLDDNTGNYLTFQDLDGIVTSDMRHHEERKKKKSLPEENRAESIEALEVESCAVAPERKIQALPLTIISKGRTLIIGSDSKTALRYGELLNEQSLTCTVCVPTGGKNDFSSSLSGSLAIVEADTVSVSGSFGGFTATAAANGNQTNLSLLLGDEAGFFDLVLDLQSTPSFTGKLLPIGYYAPGKTAAGIDEALAELPEMRGRFTKPQFNVLHTNRCFHGRSRTHDCQRCLEICPVAAITSINRKITIDPYRCQGCGGCSLVCPADAVQMQMPPQKDLLSAFAGLLSDATGEKKPPPDLVLYDLNIDSNTLRNQAGNTEDNRIFFGVEEVGRIGLEILLVGLAYGAGRITLICDPESPALIRQALQQEVKLGKMILQELHLPADRIRFIIHSPETTELLNNDLWDKAGPAEPYEPWRAPAVFPFGHDKRTLIRQAAHHLCEVSGSREPFALLPVDAPFGEIAIDATACSLCMACVGSCPSEALKANGEAPSISFVESLCHQCGLCALACPESAIRLQPRLLYNIEAADSAVVLREVEPFNCVECGEPFASQAMINRMQEKLSGHWMYSSDRQVRRLKMCRTCRTRDALTAGDFRQ